MVIPFSKDNHGHLNIVTYRKLLFIGLMVGYSFGSKSSAYILDYLFGTAFMWSIIRSVKPFIIPGSREYIMLVQLFDISLIHT